MSPLIEQILQHKSVSFVGMEKNTGKTECLNYVLRELYKTDRKIAVTSIGIDGEQVDQVTETHKPEIELAKGTIFVTSEKHYKERRPTSNILNVSTHGSTLGRLVTAQALQCGKAIISGPGSTGKLKQLLSEMDTYNVDITLIDGALSRKSFGAPTVTESLILSTGAALSPHLPELIRKTQFTTRLIHLPKYDIGNTATLTDINSGLWAQDTDGQWHDLEIPSTLLLDKYKDRLFKYGHTFYIGGIITDKILDYLRMQPHIDQTVLVAKDFTKIFASIDTVNTFLKKGGRLYVLFAAQLLAVCVNPTSPSGYTIKSTVLRDKLSEALQLPVYDVMTL